VEPERLSAAALTHVGRVREHNEDGHVIDDALGLYAVADGMGGHAAGEVASGLALETVQRVIRDGFGRISAYRANPQSRDTAQSVLKLLEEAAQAACQAVHDLGSRDADKRGMGTTLSAMLVADGEAFVAHVGDSRVYLLRGDRVHQLTQDHTVQNELLKRGKLSPEAIERVAQKNALTRAIGVYASVEVDTLQLDVLPGDRLLLCSDGLYSYLKKGELESILDAPPAEAAQRLIALANQRGGHDNITAVVLHAGDAPDSEHVRLQRLTLDTLQKATMFRYLNYQELVRVANVTETRRFVAEEHIFADGDAGDELFVVLTGKVRVQKGESVLVELGPGEHFGEMALVDRQPRSASVNAVEDTQLLVMKRRDFLGLVKHERDIAVKLLWQFLGVLTARLRNTSRELGVAKGALSGEDLDMVLSLDDLEFESNA
jgi:serine/threonine protein phosphatase PrpC